MQHPNGKKIWAYCVGMKKAKKLKYVGSIFNIIDTEEEARNHVRLGRMTEEDFKDWEITNKDVIGVKQRYWESR